MSKCLLDEFISPIDKDVDGSLWFISGLLTEVNELIQSAGKKFNTMDFKAVNTIRTIIPLVLELLLYPDEQQQWKANHIARDEKLMSSILLILQGHERKLATT